MNAYEKYYRGQAEKQKRQYDPPKRTKRFCWLLETYVDFIGTRCAQDACPHKHTVGCMEDAKLVEWTYS